LLNWFANLRIFGGNFKGIRMSGYLQALAGGIVVGLASWLLLAGIGRISGISSITSDAFGDFAPASGWRWAFLLGLVGGGAVFALLMGTPVAVPRSPWVLVPAGLLVGFGTVLGSGCTSGHGVCGLGRRSMRSLVAVLTFMGAGIATVFIAAHAMK
jgi:uncharacterized membrane protein YedE/YeeE